MQPSPTAEKKHSPLCRQIFIRFNFSKSISAGILLALFFCCNSAVAELTVASPFTNNAVLQRDMPVPVWGTADAATTITVKFGNQQKSSVADKDGNWKVQLDQMPASFEPRTLEVSNGMSKISLSNVLVGEVWICSGPVSYTHLTLPTKRIV